MSALCPQAHRRRMRGPASLIMRFESTLQGPSAWRDAVSRIDSSAEAVLEREIAQLSQSLTAQALDAQNDDDGSRHRFFLRYGVFIGLKQALALLTNAHRTVH